MEVRIKKLNPAAKMPYRAHLTDAGADLTAISFMVSKDIVTYHTGLALEIPEGYVGLLFPRSSVYKQDLSLTNCVGVIDSHYRGEVMAKFRLTDLMSEGSYNTSCIYKPGDRVCQLIIMPFPQIEYLEVDELSQTDRGAGGYGSTGK